MRIRLHDEHPAVDFGRQSKILDQVAADTLTHAAADQLIRASWPLCHACNAISAIVVDGQFTCVDCFERQLAEERVRRAIDEARQAAGGEVF